MPFTTLAASEPLEDIAGESGRAGDERTPVVTPELVIAGGTVIDGTGAPARAADVAIGAGRILDVGDIEAGQAEVVDASGLLVTPGFIDVHSHSDYTLLVDPRAMSQVFQGVTTEVVGNCGFGCFPLRDANLARTAIYGVSDAVPLSWRTPSEYLERVEAARPAVNLLSLVPNGQLRLAVVGLEDRPATPAEQLQMQRMLEEGLADGAWGYSTGLEYGAEIGASEEEVTALARITAQAGGIYATHTRDRDSAAVEAIAEALRTARAAGVRLQISHLLPRSGRAACERCLTLVDDAHSNGDDVAFDMHTRRFGLTYLHTLLPPWALSSGRETLAKRLGEPAARSRMKSHQSILSGGGFDRVVLLDNALWPQYARRSLADIGRERGQDPHDAAFDLLAGAGNDLASLMAIIECYDEEDQVTAFSHPLCVPGSDATALATDGPLAGSAFHGAYTWAAWYWRFIVRERGALSREEGVHRLTGRPAAIFGLADRGVLRRGARADIAVFDPEAFSDTGTTHAPNQLASGMHHVFVNGRATLRSGTMTGERAGSVLRHVRERGQA